MENRKKGTIYWKLLACKIRRRKKRRRRKERGEGWGRGRRRRGRRRRKPQFTNQVSGKTEQEAGASGIPTFGAPLWGGG